MHLKKIAQHTTIFNLLSSLLALGILTISIAVHASGLTASVDRNSIGLRETLTLTLSSDGQTKGTPDFSVLKNDFDILSNQRSSSIQIINGRTQSSTDWQLTLSPKRTGTLLIPSFNLDDAVSDAIEIKVSQQNQTTQSDSDENVTTSTELDKSSAYVQEQVIVTIKLITDVNLSEVKMEPLELKDALVVDLGRKQYQTAINGTQHLIVENSFALFPQESGELVIPSLSYDVVIEDMRSLWGNAFGRNRNNILRLRTDEKRIQVKAVPANQSGKTWQPATQVSISESWSGSLDHLTIGEPVTRSITINADGLSAGQIAPLTNTSVDGLTFYPDQAQTKDDKTKEGVQGTRVETIAIVPNRGGDFILPAINIDWWNTRTQKMETASLPAKTLRVLGSTTTAPTPQNLAPPVISEIKEAAPVQVKQTLVAPWTLVLAGVFALISVALAIYVVQLRRSIRQLHQEQAERENAEQEKERDIWDALKSTAATKDANALRKAVINWASFQWPTHKIHTLDDIAKWGMSKELAAELKALDEVLYSNHGNAEWDAGGLLKILNELRKQRKVEKRSPELKNLYAQ